MSSQTAPHTVLVVEDDPRFRMAVTEALDAAEDLLLVGAADDLPEGLRLLEHTAPDVLLVDIGLPSGSGIELIRRAEELLPQCDSMVITVFAEDLVVTQCIEAGATGYLLKDARGMDVVGAIRQLCAGGSPISPAIARRLLKRFGAPAVETPAADTQRALLSSQERHVLQLSAKGYSYEEIASLLKLSRHTVETYVKRIYRKLQVHTKTEAVYEARKMGLVDD